MSTAAGNVLIEGVPRRRFGYFAAVGKVTSSPLMGECTLMRTQQLLQIIL